MPTLGEKTTARTNDYSKKELDAGEGIDIVYEILEDKMESRWRLVGSTKRQCVEDIKRILANQYVLAV